MFRVRDEHADVVHAREDEDMAAEAVLYLKRWLWVARQNTNHCLEVVLEDDALLEAQRRLKTQQEREEAVREAAG